MKPLNFRESNKTLLKPRSMTDEECGFLPIYVSTYKSFCLSCWRPSLKERLSILLFGRVWLWVMSGETQPPVSLEATRNVFRIEDS